MSDQGTSRESAGELDVTNSADSDANNSGPSKETGGGELRANERDTSGNNSRDPDRKTSEAFHENVERGPSKTSSEGTNEKSEDGPEETEEDPPENNDRRGAIDNQPNRWANAPRCGAENRRGEPCLRPAMSGRKRCNLHGGKTPTADERPEIAPEQGNTRAVTHGLYMSDENYQERVSEDEQEMIYELTESMVDIWRRQHGERPPMVIRQRFESLACDINRTMQANDYLAEEGLTQVRQEVVGDESITTEKLTLWAGELRRYNTAIEERLDKLGLLDAAEQEANEPKVLTGEHVTVTVDHGSSNGSNSPDSSGDDELESASVDEDAGEGSDE